MSSKHSFISIRALFLLLIIITGSNLTISQSNDLFVEVKVKGFCGITNLDGSRGVTVSPEGENIFAGGTGDNGVSVFSRNSCRRIKGE